MIKASRYIIISIIFFCTRVDAQNAETDSLLHLLSKSAEDTGKVTLYGNISRSYRSTDLSKAIEYGQKGIELSKKLGFDKGSAQCYLNVSTAYIYSDKLDTALIYHDTALHYAHKAGDPNRLGLAYLNRADIYRQLHNINQSLKDCDTALQFADQANNDDVRARVNQTIGTIYYIQELYPSSIIYYNKAVELYRKIGNLRMSAAALNNLGLIYKNMGDHTHAINVTQEAIHITDSLKDITNLSTFNGNLSDIYFKIGDYTRSEIYADKAMEYAVKQNNEKLMAIAWSLSGNVYLKQKRYPEAISVLNKAMTIFRKIDDTERIFISADILAEAYAASGNYDKAYQSIMESRQANDSLVKWRYDDDVAAMQAKFKVNEKDKEILLLAKDKQLQQQKLERQRLLIIGTAVFALLALTGIWLIINRNKLKQRMKELELRNQIAADLHDEVGSSLSSIHMLSQIANQEQKNEASQKDILSRMSTNAKETMEKMGDIVWMIKPGESEGSSLKQRMERFAYEICGNKNINTTINLDELEKVKMTMEQRKNVYLVFKEALNNAVKYSHTEKVEISTSVQGRQLTLTVKDYGNGFDPEIIKRGYGLENMKIRAAELNGNLEIESEPGDGTTIELTVPL